MWFYNKYVEFNRAFKNLRKDLRFIINSFEYQIYYMWQNKWIWNQSRYKLLINECMMSKIASIYAWGIWFTPNILKAITGYYYFHLANSCIRLFVCRHFKLMTMIMFCPFILRQSCNRKMNMSAISFNISK